MKGIRFFLLIPILILRSWATLLVDGIAWIFSSWKKREFLFKLGILTGCMEIILSVRPWLSYTVQFLESPEIIQVSGKLNLPFFLLSLVSLYCITISESRHAFKIHLATQGLVFVLFLASFFFPNPVLHDFINQVDYRLTLNFYLFGIASFISLTLAGRITQKFQPAREIGSI